MQMSYYYIPVERVLMHASGVERNHLEVIAIFRYRLSDELTEWRLSMVGTGLAALVG